MLLKHRIKTAAVGLSTNKSRSLLTILGIVIGITSIIIVMSVGQGAENLILGEIDGIGSRTISIDPGKRASGPSDFAELYTDSLRQRDVDALKKATNVQNLDLITPQVIQPAALVYENETERASVMGVSESMPEIFSMFTDQGQFFTEADVNQRARVVVLGAELKENLFGLSDAIGQNVRIKDQSFRVIGVLEKKGQAIISLDKMAVVPYTTAQQYISGTDYFNSIALRVDSELNLDRAVADITATMRESHNIEDPDDDDFNITTQADAAETVGTITLVLTVLLGSVAGISLVVGGIGIMNIMLVSVSERTREIGLRKALGATNKDILTQFLYEAVMLTALGGLIGIILGTSISYLASLALSAYVAEGWTFTFPISAALLGLGVSGAIGLMFGIYPAKRAAQKSPMEALRYE